jgi:hypothetical protein
VHDPVHRKMLYPPSPGPPESVELVHVSEMVEVVV